MARLVCDLCHRCEHCIWTNEHYQACGIVYTEASVSIVMQHEKESHAPLGVDIALRGNEIQVKRVFREIIAPQVNELASSILSQWLVDKGKLDVDTLGEIPRLWKESDS